MCARQDCWKPNLSPTFHRLVPPRHASAATIPAAKSAPQDTIAFLFLATCFLAYSNGANDNFKGVASLFGSRTCSYKTAICWATITTAGGSLAAIYLAPSSILRALRLWFGIGKEMCFCVGTEIQVQPVPRPDGVLAAQALPRLTVAAHQPAVCRQRYASGFLGINAGRLVDVLHFLSAGAVSFARGLNDTPKIAALLLVATALKSQWGIVAVAAAMAVGGLLNARKVADTMADRITDMNPGQGFAVNLAAALLVNTASYHGLPVSTTHVSVGALLGIGIATRQAKWKPVSAVLLSWVITLPCAAALAALAYLSWLTLFCVLNNDR